jgi:hypothetical protein
MKACYSKGLFFLKGVILYELFFDRIFYEFLIEISRKWSQKALKKA